MSSACAPGPGNYHPPDSEEHYLRSLRAFPLLKAEEEVELAKRIEAGVYAAHLLDAAGGHHQHSPEELARVRADGQVAHRQMIEANARLVPFAAWRQRGRGMDYADLIAEGNLGLLRAVERFDYTKGFRFSTYAVWHIRQAIERGLKERGTALAFRLPAEVHERLAELGKYERYLQHDLQREITAQELADAAGMSVTALHLLRAAATRPFHLHQVLPGADATELSEVIPDRDSDGDTYDMAKQVAEELTWAQVRDLLSCLPERHARTLSLRFGFIDGRPRSLKEIGQEFGVSTTSVAKWQVRALATLRADPAAASLACLVVSAGSEG